MRHIVIWNQSQSFYHLSLHKHNGSFHTQCDSQREFAQSKSLTQTRPNAQWTSSSKTQLVNDLQTRQHRNNNNNKQTRKYPNRPHHIKYIGLDIKRILIFMVVTISHQLKAVASFGIRLNVFSYFTSSLNTLYPHILRYTIDGQTMHSRITLKFIT